MNLKEAYATLELSEGVSQDEAKKKYRELTKKFHPDINKEPGAEDRFKKINEAYQIVQSGKDTDLDNRQFHSSPFYRQQIRLENVDLGLAISFKDSVLGCKHEVKYSRRAKCNKCDGSGDVRLDNGCKKCGGKGQIVIRRGNSMLITNCDECLGKLNYATCNQCSGNGTIYTDVSVHVSVPAGITDQSTLRLQGMGNYVGSFMGITDQYTDAFCHITVYPESGLAVDGKHVVSHLSISLLDALKGCSRTVKTIFGDKDIDIKPKSRNRDEVIIPHCGVGGTNDQRVILDVEYPGDISKLIEVLNDSGER